MTKFFNPPPDWPEPPHEEWTPPSGWRPRWQWGAVPAGWRTWVDGQPRSERPSPLLESEDVPASGARPRDRVDKYPVTVATPGMWSHNHLDSEDYGFAPEKPVRRRPRLRLGVTIAVTVIGFLIAAATAVLFVWLTDFAVNDLPGTVSSAASLSPTVHRSAGA